VTREEIILHLTERQCILQMQGAEYIKLIAEKNQVIQQQQAHIGRLTEELNAKNSSKNSSKGSTKRKRRQPASAGVA